MNKQKIKSIFFQLIQLAVLISTVVLVGCEKIVNIDLNDAAPVIVIYGAVSDSTGPYYVSVGTNRKIIIVLRFLIRLLRPVLSFRITLETGIH